MGLPLSNSRHRKTPYSVLMQVDQMSTKEICKVSEANSEPTVAQWDGRFGDPSKHYRFSLFEKGHFSDFKLIWDDKTFSLHRRILFSESTYFQTLFLNDWKDLVPGNIFRMISPKEQWKCFCNFFTPVALTELIMNSFSSSYVIYLFISKLEN
jgi:hypothetical protein